MLVHKLFIVTTCGVVIVTAPLTAKATQILGNVPVVATAKTARIVTVLVSSRMTSAAAVMITVLPRASETLTLDSCER